MVGLRELIGSTDEMFLYAFDLLELDSEDYPQHRSIRLNSAKQN
jgi:hypothetical protein